MDYEKILKLKELLDKGIITQDQFQELKRKELGLSDDRSSEAINPVPVQYSQEVINPAPVQYSQEAINPAPVQYSQEAINQAPVQYSQEVPQPVGKKKKNTKKLILIIGIALLALIVLCAVLGSGSKEAAIKGYWHAVEIGVDDDDDTTSVPEILQDDYTLEIDGDSWYVDINGDTYDGTFEFDQELTDKYDDGDYWYTISFSGSGSDDGFIVYDSSDDILWFYVEGNFLIYERD